ncbi:uncharacterized protein LOC115227347 [Octopus sinensis]|uniref:Uncharacterized protein LOC115227347 n=1 Tax=Octopus sinensis TaxID=2607531 RepID=A0A6P7TVX9_9MOLL|nr:uncharacterized protein LOC115227347 [Octopus sinensis]
MEKIKYRAVLKYLHLKGMIPPEIHEDMVRTLTENAPSYATVKRWVNENQCSRVSVKDDPRPGRPPTSTIEYNIDLALGMIMQDRRISCYQIAERLGISTERAENIVTKELGFSKVSARWVSRLLNPNRNAPGGLCPREIWNCLKPRKIIFLFVSLLWTKAGFKEQSEQWKHISFSTPKKARVIPSAGKVMMPPTWLSRKFIALT